MQPLRIRPLGDRVGISERPAEANARSEFGHWEADLVERLDARSFLSVLRERKSRLCRIVRTTAASLSNPRASLPR